MQTWQAVNEQVWIHRKQSRSLLALFKATGVKQFFTPKVDYDSALDLPDGRVSRA